MKKLNQNRNDSLKSYKTNKKDQERKTVLHKVMEKTNLLHHLGNNFDNMARNMMHSNIR
jgi:hypothetical protein